MGRFADRWVAIAIALILLATAWATHAKQLAALDQSATADAEHLPIIAMTAHAMLEERRQCLEAGMNDHLTKPIDTVAVTASLRRWLCREPAGPG